MNAIGDFHLSNLPLQLPSQTENHSSSDQLAQEKGKIETLIQALLNKNMTVMNPDNSAILINFFERMMIDKDWMSKNTSIVNQVIRAVSYFFLYCDNSTVTEKIKKIVQDKWSSPANAFTDFELKVETPDDKDQTKFKIKACVLVLSSYSPFFEALFRSKLSEGNRLTASINSGQNLPYVEMKDFSYKVMKAYIEILNGTKTSLNNWSVDDLHGLLRCFDMAGNLEAFIPKLESLLLEETSINAENALNWYELAKEIEFFPKLEQRCNQIVQEKVQANPKNVYLLSLSQNLTQLKTLSLEFIFKTIKWNDKEAFKGAASGVIPGHEYLEKGDAKFLCHQYLLNQLPVWLKDARCKWDANQKQFVNIDKSSNKLVSSLKSLVSKKEDNESLIEKLNAFAALASEIRVVRQPCLKELSEEHLEWLLNQISKDTIELNLDSVKPFNMSQLSRFINLETLSLRQCAQITALESLKPLERLKSLNLDSCFKLTTLDFLPHFKKLEFLNLKDVFFLKDFTPLLETPSLKVVNVIGCNDKFQKILSGQHKKMTFRLISEYTQEAAV